MNLQFIGDGGHAGNLRLQCQSHQIVQESEHKVLAFGGVTCEALEKRYNERPEGKYPNLLNSTIASNALPKKTHGIQTLAGSIIQNNAVLGDFCIINTGAIVEHDAVIGKGSHIAPGAVVLGGAQVGDFCFVGANAVIVQGSIVPDRTFVKAGSVWKS